MGWLKDETGLEKNRANYAPLTPLSHLNRAKDLFADELAVVYGAQHRKTYRDYHARVTRLASALAGLGVEPGDVVATILPNLPAQVEAQFAVPACGAVLNAINTRLDTETVAYIFGHGEAKLALVDTAHLPLAEAALAAMEGEGPKIIEVADPSAGFPATGTYPEYEELVKSGDPAFQWIMPEDEWESIALNYTSGTTGDPKGVVYHHRGAYLNALGNVLAWNLPQHPVYLWTLPMFHCNGWCFPWTVTAMAGTHVCLRKVEAGALYEAFAEQGVTHLCGAPIVMQMILGAKPEERRDFAQTVQMMTAAAPPPAAVLAAMQEQGIEVTHVYGLTEVYGPAVVCAWHEAWDREPIETQAELKSRQGVAYPVLEGLMVADPETLAPVPADGETLGEVFMRGNIVMKGYLKNPAATERAFAGGWFHTGDLGVVHPDGYVQLKDRSKDIIISGGENISSIEIEDLLYRHPAVAGVAVVAKPDEKWGETPCAFVELKPGAMASSEELIAFCRERLAHFKCPRHIVFGELPKTSTGKIQKFVLRERARAS